MSDTITQSPTPTEATANLYEHHRRKFILDNPGGAEHFTLTCHHFFVDDPLLTEDWEKKQAFRNLATALGVPYDADQLNNKFREIIALKYNQPADSPWPQIHVSITKADAARHQLPEDRAQLNAVMREKLLEELGQKFRFSPIDATWKKLRDKLHPNRPHLWPSQS